MSRFKVWPIENGKLKLEGLLLRTGSIEPGSGLKANGMSYDVYYAGDTPAEVAAFACARTGYVGDVYVKNFTTNEWFKVTVGAIVVESLKEEPE